ncbi:MAG: zinc-binding dehydrogenase, partial [Acidimicrobiales bacterium]
DVVLELIGAPNLDADLDALATGGRVSIIGVGGGAVGELNLLKLMSKRGRIHGSTLRPRPLEDKAAVAQGMLRHVLPLVKAGLVRVPVEQTFTMEDAALAYERFAQGGKLGKIVLTND